MGIGANQYLQTPFVMPQQYVQPLAPSYAKYSVSPADLNKSMAEQMIARAQYAYENMLPPATLAQLFPTLGPALEQSIAQAPQSSGAGRFLTGGLLNT